MSCLENKMKLFAVICLLVHVVVKAALLFSPLMSDIFSFEVAAIDDTALYAIYSDIFYIKLFSYLTDNVLFLRSVYFLFSLCFVLLLIDVLKTYFSDENAFLWGIVFVTVPSAFFSYHSILFVNTCYVFWIATLLGLKLLHVLLYSGKNISTKFRKCIYACTVLFFLIYGFLIYLHGYPNDPVTGIKHFYIEVVPFMFGYMSDFRPYAEFDRLQFFLSGLYIYFFVFFLWHAVLKGRNILNFFAGKKTNRTEIFFALYLLFMLFFVFSDNSDFIKVMVFGFLYIASAGMFCFFMKDVFNETKVFAIILCLIIVVFGINDNRYLISKAYTSAAYGDVRRTALKLKAMDTGTVVTDRDLWLPLSFYLKGSSVVCRVIDEDTNGNVELRDGEVLLVHKDKGALSPNRVRSLDAFKDAKECSVGKYHIFS